MNPGELLKILNVAEKLKCNTRHCYTSSGRHESVAEHCWRTALMAMLLETEFPQADMNKVIKNKGRFQKGYTPILLQIDNSMSDKEKYVRIALHNALKATKHPYAYEVEY